MRELIPAPSLSDLLSSTDSSIRVETDEGTTSLAIAKIQLAATQQKGYESFSVILTGPVEDLLPSGMYRMEHDALGPFDLCLNPTWGNHGSTEVQEYQAVFNRAVEPGTEEASRASAMRETSSRRGFFSKIAAAAAGGSIIAGLFGADTAEANPAGIAGAPLSSQPYIGGIGMFGGNFAPLGWADCNGQLIAISQNQALFSLIGTIYGGDGRTTLALPDLRGRVPIHTGQGPGLTSRFQGQRGGSERTTLTPSQIPNHTHAASLPVSSAEGDATSPDGNTLGAQPESRGTQPIYSTGAPDGSMSVTNAAVGGSQSHDNMPPFTVIRYIIAIQGIFPSRS